MGQAATAKIVFGFRWEEGEIEGLWEQIDALAEKDARAAGAVNPWDKYPEGLTRQQSDEWRKANGDALDAWYAAKRKSTEAAGVKVEYFGTDQWAETLLTVTDERACILHWRTKTLAPDLLTGAPAEEWEATIRAVLERLGIEPPSEWCAWHFGAFYG